jgi:hypothetical protein
MYKLIEGIFQYPLLVNYNANKLSLHLIIKEIAN